MDFEAPADYVEPKAPSLKPSKSSVDRDEAKKDAEKLSAIEHKYQRLDGKKLTDKQKLDLLNKLKSDEKQESPDFDPRKHRLVHGIPNYTAPG